VDHGSWKAPEDRYGAHPYHRLSCRYLVLRMRMVFHGPHIAYDPLPWPLYLPLPANAIVGGRT
jgi:hypothetical protein